MVGTSISHYRIDSELGRGGMGIVYRALDTKLNRTVALKVLPTAVIAGTEERSRFYREARSAAAMSHPNIATVYAIDEAVPDGSREDDVRPFIAMEFVDGISLSAQIAEGPIELDRVVSVGTQLASALQAAHDKTIVHRDIKSSNVMLTSNGDVKVLDFGLAKTLEASRLTLTGSTLGTMSYMSPEQARGEEVDPRTDLWSLGVVLYEMVSGLLPFGGEYEQAAVYSILNEDPRPLTAMRTGVPAELQWIVDKLLEKDRALRYQSAADVLADLKRLQISLLGGSAITKTRMAPPTGGMFSKLPSTKISRPAFGVLTLALFVIGVGSMWMLHDRAEGSAGEAGPMYLDLILPDSVVFDHPSWSPDGKKILFSAEQGRRKGYIVEYDLGKGTLTELTDADYNQWPKYSPDGRSIFFVSGGKTLMRQAIGSSQPGPVTEVARKDGLVWISPHEIVFARSRTVLVKDLISGQEDTLNPKFPGANWFHHPAVTPDSSILITGTYWGIRALDLATREMLPAFNMDDYQVGSTPSGHILYEPLNRPTVWARKVDTQNQAFDGQGFVLFEAEGSRIAVSQTGHLVYQPRVDPEVPWYLEPIYVYKNGQRGAFVAHAGTYSDGDHDEFRVTPDGRHLAVKILGGGILLYERSSRTSIELVKGALSTDPYPGQFSHDGRWLYYQAFDSTGWGVYRIRSDGSASPERVVAGPGAQPSISGDDRTLVFTRGSEQTKADIWTMDLTTGQESPLVVADGWQSQPRISPDGRLVAFESRDQRGEPSVLVKDLGDGTTTSVAEGMSRPRWDWQGAYLYFESKLLGEIYRVRVRTSDGFSFGGEQTMYSDFRSDHTHWDTLPEDDTILVSSPEGGLEGGSRWKVVLNWAQTLEG